MARAILKFIRVSPIKARLIAREVQGMNAEYAIASLQFTPNKAAGIISKVTCESSNHWWRGTVLYQVRIFSKVKTS